MKPGEITFVDPPKKQLRMTASEVELRNRICALPDVLEILDLLNKIKRQMYLDGAEDMVQSLKRAGFSVSRTNTKVQP